jgi:hypothetical protein
MWSSDTIKGGYRVTLPVLARVYTYAIGSPAAIKAWVGVLFMILKAAKRSVTVLWLDVIVFPPEAASMADAVAILVIDRAVTSAGTTVYVAEQFTVSPISMDATPPQVNAVPGGVPMWSSATMNGAYKGTSPLFVNK